LSTIYVHNSGERINLIYGLTAVEAKSLMSKGYEKALNVLVEDNVAHAILTELLRRINPNLLATIGIYPAGGADTLRTTIRTVSEAGLRVAVVLDVTNSPHLRKIIEVARYTASREGTVREPRCSSLRSGYLWPESTGFLCSPHWCESPRMVREIGTAIGRGRLALTWELARYMREACQKLKRLPFHNNYRKRVERETLPKAPH